MDLGILYYSDLRPYSITAVIRNIGYQFSPYDEKREDIAYDIKIEAKDRDVVVIGVGVLLWWW